MENKVFVTRYKTIRLSVCLFVRVLIPNSIFVCDWGWFIFFSQLFRLQDIFEGLKVSAYWSCEVKVLY